MKPTMPIRLPPNAGYASDPVVSTTSAFPTSLPDRVRLFPDDAARAPRTWRRSGGRRLRVSVLLLAWRAVPLSEPLLRRASVPELGA